MKGLDIVIDFCCRNNLSFFYRAIAIFWGVIVYFFLFASVGETASRDKERWDRKYDTEQYVFGKVPVAFLKEHLHILPKGKTLDIAMGEGRNGVFLATQGFEVTGIDISETGLNKAQALAREHRVTIKTQVVDLDHHKFPEEIYDLIICTYYLQRDLFPKIVRALKPGGMVLVETYTVDYLKYRSRFPRQYLLERNELFQQFQHLQILRYQLQDDGKTAYASILAQKP